MRSRPRSINYLRDELGFETDLRYYLFGPVRPWGNHGDHDVAEELRRAMAQNPYLELMVQSGYYNGTQSQLAGDLGEALPAPTPSPAPRPA